jgi:tol-pal system protein YbgF
MVALLATVTGCATTPPPPDPLEETRRAKTELSNQQDNLRTSVQKLTQRLTAAERDIARLRGEMEVVNNTAERLKSQVASMKEERAAAVVAAPPPAPPTDGGGTPPAATEAPPQAAAPQQAAEPAAAVRLPATNNPNELYQFAYSAMQTRQYGPAMEGFRSFVKSFQADARAPSAQYWTGEIHYAQRNFAEALVAYNQVILRWPASDKVPNSLLKIGYAFFELGDYANAKASLTRLVNEFPENATVKNLAQEKLKKINEVTGAKPTAAAPAAPVAAPATVQKKK